MSSSPPVPSFQEPTGPDPDLQHESGLVNYAAASVGAELTASSPSFHNAGNLLARTKDKYAMADCDEEPKWVSVRLGSEIHVDVIAISNNERHASGVKRFKVFAGMDKDGKDWSQIGYFEAEHTGEEQVFRT